MNLESFKYKIRTTGISVIFIFIFRNNLECQIINNNNNNNKMEKSKIYYKMKIKDNCGIIINLCFICRNNNKN